MAAMQKDKPDIVPPPVLMLNTQPRVSKVSVHINGVEFPRYL